MNLLIKNIKQLVTVRSNGNPYKSGNDMRDLGIIENATVLIEKWTLQVDRPAPQNSRRRLDDTIDTIDASDLVGTFPGSLTRHTHLLFPNTGR